MYYKDVTNCSNLCWNFDENYRLNKPIDNSSLYNIAIMLRKTKVKKRKKQLLCRTHSGTTLNYQHKHNLSTHLSCQQSIQHSLAYDLSSKYDLKQRKYVDLQIDNKNYDDDKQCQMMNKCVAIKKHFPLPKWNDEMVDPNNNNENDEENNDIKQYLGLLNLQSNLNNERGKDQDKTTIATRTLSIECNTTNDSSNVCNQLPLPKELFNHDQLSFTSSSSSSSSSSSLCYGVKEWRSYRPKMNYSSDSSSTSSSSTLIVQCLLLVLITLISSNSFRSMALPVFAVANPLLSDAVNSLPLPYITFNDSGIIVDRRHRHSTTTRPISTWLSIIDERNQRPESNSIIRFETIGTRSYHNNGFTTHSNELQSSEIDQDDNIQTNYSAKRIMPSYTVDDRYQWICFDSINRYPTIDNETQWTLNKLFQLNSNIWSMKSFKNLNQTQPTIKLCVRRATNYDLSHLNKNGKVAINVDDQQNVRIKKKLKRQQQQLPKRRDDRTTTNLISNDRTVQMATSTIHNNNNFVTTMARNDKRLCQTYVDDDDDNDDENEHWATSEKSSECATDEAIRIGMGIESLLYIVRNKLYQMRHKMMPYPKENKMKWDDRNKGKQFDTKMDSDFGVRCRSCRSSHSCQTERKRNDRMTMTMPMIMMNESASSDNGQNRQKTTTMTTISTINEHKPNSTKHSILIEQKLKMLTNDGTRSSESSKTDSGIRINTFESGDAANNVKLTTIVDRLRQETMNNYNVNGKLNASDTDLFHHHHKLGKSGKNVHNQNQTIENQIDDHKVVQSITLNSLIIYVDVNQEEMKETNDLPHNETNQLIVRVRSVTNNSIKISDLQWEVCHFQLSSASNVSSSIVKCHTIVGKHLLTILNDLDRELCWLERFQRNETDHIVETSLHSMKTIDEHFSSTTKLDDNTQNRNCNNDLWPSYNLTRSNNNTRTNNNSLIRWWHKLTRKQTVEMDRQQTPIPVGNNGNDIGHNRNPVNHRYAENLRIKVRAQIMVTTPNVPNVVKTPILVHHDTTPTQWNINRLLYGLNNDETKPTTIASTKMTTTKSTKIFNSNNENVWNMIPNQNDKTNADEVSKPKTMEIGLKWPLKTMDDRMYHNWPIENDDQLKKRMAVKMNEDDAQVMLDLLPSSILSTPPPPPSSSSSSSSATHNRDGRRRRLMSISFNDADSIDDEGGHHIDINSNNSNNNNKNGKQANAVKLESTGYNRNLVITNISDKSNQSILHNRATINRLNTEQKPTMMTIDANVFQQIENEKDSNWTIIKHHDIGNDENATTTTGNRIITTTTSTTTTSTTTTTISNNSNDQISTKLLKRVKQVRATFQFDKSNNTNRLPSNSIQLQSSLNIEQDQMLLKSNSSSSSSSVQLPQDILALHWKSCSTLNGTNCTNAIESSQTELSQSLSPTSTTIDWLSSNTIITDVSVNNRTTPISVLKVETSTNSQHDQTNLGLNNLMPQPITTTTASTISRFMFEPTNNVKRKTTTVTLPINVTSNLDRIELLSVNKNVTTIETGTKWINGIHSTNGSSSSSSSSSSTAIPARIMKHVQNETLLSNIAVDISVINDELNANNRLNDHIDASNITINRSNNHINNDGILMAKMPVNVNDRIDLMENGDSKIRFPNSTTTTTTLFTNSTLLQSTNVNVLNELSYENDDDIDRININNHNKNDCPPNHESNDGIHLWWTRTDSGVLAVQPCQPIALYSGTIFRPCYTSGEWGYTDWSECRLKPLREIHRLVLQHVQKHLLDGLVPLAIQLKRLLLPMVIVLNGTNTNVSTITNQRTTKTTTTNTSSSNSSTTVAVASLLHSPLDRIDALSSLNAILLNSKIRIRIDHDVDDERRTIQFVQTLILISQHLLVETKSIQFLDDDVTQEQNAILIGHLVETFNSFRLMVENLLRSLILSCQDGSIDLLQRQTEPLLPPMLDHIEITLSHRDSASNQMVTLISSKMSHHNGGPHKVVDANETMIMNHDNRRKRTKRTSLMVKHDRRYEARLLWTTLRQYQPKLSINFEDFSKMGVGVAEIWFHDMGNSLDYGNNRLLSDLLLVSIVPAVSIEVDFEHSPQFELIFPLYEFKLNIQSTMANKNDDIVMNDTNDSNERHRQPFINDNNNDDDDDNMSNDEAIELIHDYGWSRNKKNLNSDEDDEDEYNFETNDDGNDEIGKTKIGCGRLLPNVHQTSIWTSNGCTSLSINRTHLRCRCMKPGIFGAITFPLISSTIDEAFGGGMSVENQNMHIERPNDSKPLNTNRSAIELSYVHNRNHIHNHHHHFESHFRTRLSNYDLSLYFSFIFGIIFLLITLIIQYRLRQYETRETYFIVRNLCITLFLIQFTFLFGTTFHMDAFWIRIAQLSSQTIQTEFFHRVKHAICLAVPVFLHFIHLVTLFWMLSHTIMLYQRFWKPTSSFMEANDHQKLNETIKSLNQKVKSNCEKTKVNLDTSQLSFASAECRRRYLKQAKFKNRYSQRQQHSSLFRMVDCVWSILFNPFVKITDSIKIGKRLITTKTNFTPNVPMQMESIGRSSFDTIQNEMNPISRDEITDNIQPEQLQQQQQQQKRQQSSPLYSYSLCQSFACQTPLGDFNWKCQHYLTLSMAIPFLLVLASYLLNPRGYETRRYCWMSIEGGIQYSFIIPVLVLITTNTLLMLWVLKRYFERKPMTHRIHLVQIRPSLRASITLLPFFSLNWFLSVLSLETLQTTPFELIFAITNCLHSFMVFYFHCYQRYNIHYYMKARYSRLHLRRRFAKMFNRLLSTINLWLCPNRSNGSNLSQSSSFNWSSEFGPSSINPNVSNVSHHHIHQPHYHHHQHNSPLEDTLKCIEKNVNHVNVDNSYNLQTIKQTISTLSTLSTSSSSTLQSESKDAPIESTQNSCFCNHCVELNYDTNLMVEQQHNHHYHHHHSSLWNCNCANNEQRNMSVNGGSIKSDPCYQAPQFIDYQFHSNVQYVDVHNHPPLSNENGNNRTSFGLTMNENDYLVEKSRSMLFKMSNERVTFTGADGDDEDEEVVIVELDDDDDDELIDDNSECDEVIESDDVLEDEIDIDDIEATNLNLDAYLRKNY